MDEKEAEARPVMGTIFLVIYIYISREISIEHPSVGLALLAQLPSECSAAMHASSLVQ